MHDEQEATCLHAGVDGRRPWSSLRRRRALPTRPKPRSWSSLDVASGTPDSRIAEDMQRLHDEVVQMRKHHGIIRIGMQMWAGGRTCVCNTMGKLHSKPLRCSSRQHPYARLPRRYHPSNFRRHPTRQSWGGGRPGSGARLFPVQSPERSPVQVSSTKGQALWSRAWSATLSCQTFPNNAGTCEFSIDRSEQLQRRDHEQPGDVTTIDGELTSIVRAARMFDMLCSLPRHGVCEKWLMLESRMLQATMPAELLHHLDGEHETHKSHRPRAPREPPGIAYCCDNPGIQACPQPHTHTHKKSTLAAVAHDGNSRWRSRCLLGCCQRVWIRSHRCVPPSRHARCIIRATSMRFKFATSHRHVRRRSPPCRVDHVFLSGACRI